MSDAAREIIEVLATEADRADANGVWSFLILQTMARCAQRVIAAEAGVASDDPSALEEVLMRARASLERAAENHWTNGQVEAAISLIDAVLADRTPTTEAA